MQVSPRRFVDEDSSNTLGSPSQTLRSAGAESVHIASERLDTKAPASSASRLKLHLVPSEDPRELAIEQTTQHGFALEGDNPDDTDGQGQEPNSGASDGERRSGPCGQLRWCLDHLLFNIAMIVLLLADLLLLIFLIFDLTDQSRRLCGHLNFVLQLFFALEIFLRIGSHGGIKSLASVWQILDLFLVGFALFAAMDVEFDVWQLSAKINGWLIFWAQIVRVATRLFIQGRRIPKAARNLVSRNKMRYSQDGFDLDLTYINDRVIAMGLPSQKMEAMYRNNINEVARFFEVKHKDRFLIFNLCTERSYDPSFFGGRVAEQFRFDDHNPPPLLTMCYFCWRVDEWLHQDSDNVIAIHCKGGKGRTGTMVCAWLLYSELDQYADQVLRLFATKRTDTDIGHQFQGVAQPSQIRYVHYFEQLRARAMGGQPGPTQSLRWRDACMDMFANPPLCELKRLVLNNVGPPTNGIPAGAKAGNRSRVDPASLAHWSLVITHYPAVTLQAKQSVGERNGSSSPRHFDSGINRYDLLAEELRANTKEYVFQAEANVEEDQSVVINVASWQSKQAQLILAGDMKFTVFRGDLELPSPSKKRGSLGAPKPKQFCVFWLNSMFMRSNHSEFILRPYQLDELYKDSSIDPDFNIVLSYQIPPRRRSVSVL